MNAVRARDNPFATDRLEALGYRSPRTGEPIDLERLVERLEALGRRAAIVGPEGSGKTTLLDDLESRLVARGVRIRRLRAAAVPGTASGELVEERHREKIVSLESLGRESGAEEPGGRPLLILDGADRLKRRVWRRIGSRAGPLLVTSHRPGLLPTLTECATSPGLLERLITELLEAGGCAPPRPLPSAEELHARHRGNLRTALLELYDRSAGIR